jgi:P-type Cu2+ transporter
MTSFPQKDAYAALAKTEADGTHRLEILVDGVHCANCIQRIESRLSREPDVASARLNFSTRRLTINWRGLAANANHYVDLVKSLGYTVHPYNAQAEMSDTRGQENLLLLCLAVSGFAMGNIMLLSLALWTTTGDIMGYSTRDFMHWISGLIALPTVVYAGRPFFYSAAKALRQGATNMDVPISVALILTSLTSLYQTASGAEHAYFDSVVMLMFFLLIGRYLDLRARRSARSAANDLLSTLSGFATVLDGAQTRQLPIRDIRENMMVRVMAGERFPVDGTLTDGLSEVDTSLVTGETIARPLNPGVDVFAGTMNLNAPVTIRVARIADDSLLADIVRLMERAEQGQARYVRLADRVARFYTPVVHTVALAAFLFWWAGMGLDVQASVMIAVAVLIITCPCALALAVPVVQVMATGQMMRRGILVKSGDVLERLARVNTIILDKTGTLTRGQPLLQTSLQPDVLALAASLAAHSHHPYAQAVRSAYSGPLLQVSDVHEYTGDGLKGQVDHHQVRLGKRSWCGDQTAAPASLPELWVEIDGHATAMHFADQLRDDAKDVIATLKNRGYRLILLSGDQIPIVKETAEKLGIAEWHGEQTPPQKFDLIERLRNDRRDVLMVGDGLNDAPALSHANVSMAPGSAIDMAQNAADIVFMGESLRPIVTVCDISKFSQRLVVENFVLTLIYNAIAIPIAVAGFVTPLIAALAMSGSSLVVIGNAFRLKGQK